MIQNAGQTQNFTVQFDDSIPKADIRAAALIETVELQFNTYASLFQIAAGFGPGNRITLIVDLTNGGGDNEGYHSDGSSFIEVDAQSTNSNDANAAELVKTLMVAELVEIFMDYNNIQSGNTTWGPGWSNGEGLSRVCGRESSVFAWDKLRDALDVGFWLHSPEDWISNTEHTDQNPVSFGCAVLFIYYMKSQLNYPLKQIIQNGGGNLEDTFHNLTGRSGGLQELKNLLNHFLGSNWNSIDTDDPFPYLEPSERNLYLSTAIIPGFSSKIPIAKGVIKETFLGCGAKEYPYTLTENNNKLSCTATNSGFTTPDYTWFVNDVQLQTYLSSIQCFAMVYQNDPANPFHLIGTAQKITVNYTIGGNFINESSVINLEFPGITGHVDLYIEVQANDTNYMSGIILSETLTVHFSKVDLMVDKQYYDDGKHCRDKLTNELRELAHPFADLSEQVAILFTLPDPALRSEITLRRFDEQIAFIERNRERLPGKIIGQLEGFVRNGLAAFPSMEKLLG